MLLSVNKVNNVISGVVGKKRYAVPFTIELFDYLQELEELFEMSETVVEATDIIKDAERILKSTSLSQSITCQGSGLHFNQKLGTLHLKEGNSISEQPIPKKLADIMIKMFEEGNTIQPLVRAWTLFLRNPNFTPEKAELFANYITTTAVDQEEYEEYLLQGYSEFKAKELATYHDVSITKEGLLVTNKYVDYVQSSDNYDEEYEQNQLLTEESTAEETHLLPPLMRSRGDMLLVNGELTHLVKVGKVHSLPNWSYVDCNDNNFAVKGAHLGGRLYIQGYEGRTSILLDCLVSPDQIGAFDHSGNGAIRVLSYFVFGANFARNKGLYHTTAYAAKIEEDWANARTLAVEESNAIINKLKAIKKITDDLLSQAELGLLSSKDADKAIANLGIGVLLETKSDIETELSDINLDKFKLENLEVKASPPDEDEDDDDELDYCKSCGNECDEGDWECDDCRNERESEEEEEDNFLTIDDLNMGDYDLTIEKYSKVNDLTELSTLVFKFFKDLGVCEEHNFETFCEWLEMEDTVDRGFFTDDVELIDLLNDYYTWEIE